MLVVLLGLCPAVLRAERLDPWRDQKVPSAHQRRHHAYAVGRLQGVTGMLQEILFGVIVPGGRSAHARGP